MYLRYAANYVNDLKGANSVVIPTPFSLNLHSSKTINLRSGQWVVIIPDDASLQAEAQYISGEILTKKFYPVAE